VAVAYARRVEAASTRTRFQTLAAVNGAMVAGEATMVVALADSFFFDVDLDGARSRLLAFLVVSFAPFLFVASFTGRLIDRARGGRRAMVVLVAVVRAAVQVAMIAVTDDIALFPLVFAALVLQKTYNVSKQALVPAVVSDEDELVEANSKLGFMAGLAGAAAVVPAAGVQLVLGAHPQRHVEQREPRCGAQHQQGDPPDVDVGGGGIALGCARQVRHGPRLAGE
jgi:hypothetical protein